MAQTSLLGKPYFQENYNRALKGNTQQKRLNICLDRLKLSLNYGLNVRGRRLVWFRTLAFQANDPGFKSRRPHHNNLLFCKLKLFTELFVENCVIRCFNWFSKVLLRLKPGSFDFSANSLSR